MATFPAHCDRRICQIRNTSPLCVFLCWICLKSIQTSSSRVTPVVLFSAFLPNKGLQMMQWGCLTAEPACGWTSLVPVALTVRWVRPWSFPTDDLLTSWPWEHLINSSDINGPDNDNIIMTILLLKPPFPVDRMLHWSVSRQLSDISCKIRHL